jgi:hypothetical protein
LIAGLAYPVTQGAATGALLLDDHDPAAGGGIGVIKWDDRTVGITSLVISGVSIVIGAAALVLAYLVLPSITQNDHFCYSLNIKEYDDFAPRKLFDPPPVVERVEHDCFYTRADCEAQRAKSEADPPWHALYVEPAKISSQCERGD